MQLIPALDVAGGRCVRLEQGDFESERCYAIDPATVLARYVAWGAAWVHLVDLDGARSGVRRQGALIERLVRTGGAALQIGGGIRSAEALAAALAAGATRVVVGSAAVERPEEVRRWLEHHGAERIVLALDVRIDADGTPRVASRGWQAMSALSLWDALAPYPTVRHVLCTDVQCDGMLGGPNLALYREAVARFPLVAWQASGGVRDRADLEALATTGVAAAIAGRALLEDRIQPEELAPYLRNA
jgi:phosphoribosylformimino-5-aminoimidazole carboxamide ribotide isomerase